MAGISDKALKDQYAENRYKYNGIEYDSAFGLDTYEAHFRDLDPQTGRWWQIDPKIDNGYESITPYASMYNDPEKFSDPLGDEGEEASGCCKVLKQIFASASGTVASFIDNNVPGSNIRGAVASSGIIEDPDVAESWNTALDASDKASMVQGTAEMIGGEGLKDGGTALTIGSGGTASEISLPVVGVGLGLQVHGAFVTAKAAASLATQNGRVQIHGNSADSQAPTGNYENTHRSGKTYNGVGDRKRMDQSADNIAKKNNDPVVKQKYRGAPNRRTAYIREHRGIKRNGGAGNTKRNYNVRNSPGKKLSGE